MYVVAHEDDDLLFMNPDIAASIAAGHRVVIVHVTAGDLPPDSVPDFTQYWIDRERGILNAFSAMAGAAAFDRYAPVGTAPDGWTASVATYGALAAARYDLGDQISAVFLRLSDYQLDDAWNDRPGAGGQLGGAMLPPGDTWTLDCLDATACTLGTTIASQTLSRDQLIDVLADVIASFAAGSVSMQDATSLTPEGIHWDDFGTPGDGFTDYWDHVFSAGFTLAAAARAQARMTTPLALRMYRGYTISQEPENLGDGDALAKARVFARYAVFDTSIEEPGAAFDVEHPRFHGGDYELDTPGSWQHREVATRTLLAQAPLQGRLAIAGNCVGTPNGSVEAVPCDGAPAWTITATNQLAFGASCLAVRDDSVVVLAPCATQSEASTLFLFGNGQLRASGARCVTLRGAAFAAQDCDHQPPAPHATGLVPFDQDFTLLFASPRAIAGAPAGSDLWIVRGHACARDDSGVTCAAWSGGALAAPSSLASVPADATDVAVVADGGALTACARSGGVLACGARSARDHAADAIVRYADVTGQGGVDACGATAHGIACSLDTGGAWSAARSWSDAAFTALQLGDVDGDGLADACGDGLACASQVGGAFAGLAPRAFDEDRTAGIAYDFAGADYRLVDINHDGLADACARDDAGVWCALSTGTAFEREKLVVPAALLDGPLAWGDLDGDARVDACALPSDGLACAAGY